MDWEGNRVSVAILDEMGGGVLPGHERSAQEGRRNGRTRGGEAWELLDSPPAILTRQMRSKERAGEGEEEKEGVTRRDESSRS